MIDALIQQAIPTDEGFLAPSGADVRVVEESAAPLRAMLAAVAQAHGLVGAVYIHLGHGFRRRLDPSVHVGPRRLVATRGFDEAQYGRRSYLAFDPLALRASESHMPFEWRLADMEDANVDRRRLFGAMAAWGMHEGVVAPVQDYALGPALLNLFGPRCGPIDHGALMLAAVQVHQTAASLPEPRRTIQDFLLNPREMEVLRLAAVGRTEQETAMALALSRRGVQFHLARAIEKLGAPNKTAAVARAVDAGLIRL